MSKPTEQLEDMINRCRKYCSLETQVLIAEIDRLRAPRQAEGWQPIETAPKDGRLLLLYCDYGDGEREMYIAHYVIPIAPGGKFGPFIWKTQGSGGVAEKIPTHWMPLPEPPARVAHSSQMSEPMMTKDAGKFEADRAAERVQRDRPATNPGGMVCAECSEVFIGEEWHALCAICEARRIDR